MADIRDIRNDAQLLLETALNNSNASFRDGQWSAISELLRSNSRLLVVQRTGWGKSLVYFIATKLLRDRGAGITLLISPMEKKTMKLSTILLTLHFLQKHILNLS